MTDDVYEQQNFGNSVGFGRKPALLIVDFQVGFADPQVFGGGNITQASEATRDLLDGTWIIRRPQEDFCQALGFGPGQKY